MPAGVLKHRPRALLAAAALALCSLACGNAGLDVTGVAHEGVVGGSPSGADEDDVVLVSGDSGTMHQVCSGTLVAPNLLLTAHHCIAAYVDAPFTCTSQGDLVPGSVGGQMGALLAPSAIGVHLGATPSATPDAVGVQIFATQSTSICRNDLALVVLDRELSAPLATLRLTAGSSPGEVLRVVGYGATENGGFGLRLARDGLTISLVGTSQFRPSGDPVPPRTFVTEGPALCPGDSGGPAFDAQRAVNGVFSQFTGDCTSSSARDLFTELAPFNDELVTPAFAAAGHTPIIEQLPDAGIPDAGVSDASTDYYEPRQPGGCRCRLGTSTGSGARSGLALALALVLAARRARRALNR